MKVSREISISEFEAWSGAEQTKEAIVNAGKEEEFDYYIEELYHDGVDETQLNDILWFDGDQILSDLGIIEDEDPDEEETEEDEE